MTTEQKLKSLNPCRIIIGYDANGNFLSTIIETKEEFIIALERMENFRIYKLSECEQEPEWFKTQAKKYKKLKEANENKL